MQHSTVQQLTWKTCSGESAAVALGSLQSPATIRARHLAPKLTSHVRLHPFHNHTWRKMFSLSILPPPPLPPRRPNINTLLHGCTNLIQTRLYAYLGHGGQAGCDYGALSVRQSFMRCDSVFIRTPHGRVCHPLPLLLILKTRVCVMTSPVDSARVTVSLK